MTRPLPFTPVMIGSLLLGAVLLTGCGGKDAGHDEAGHGEHAEGEAEGGATFKPGSGLQLAPAVVRALAISTADAKERSLAPTLVLTAQVYAAGPQGRAVALVSADQAGRLKPGLPAKVKHHDDAAAELTAISNAAEKATGQVELVFALTHAPSLAVGDTLTLALTLSAAAPALAVPRSALLDTASGTFVYLVNGSAYLRTPVKTGAADDNDIEITDGLYEGDIVVVSPVSQLWLSELRLTKGGGHSH